MMSRNNISRARRMLWCCRYVTSLILVAVFAPNVTSAAELTISARFAPDAGNPHNNKFINTTPLSGYCERWPNDCAHNGSFSIMTPIETIPAPITADHSDPRQGAMIKLPTEWRDAVVMSETGETQTVRMRIIAFGGAYVLDPFVNVITGVSSSLASAHNALWHTGSWNTAASPCVSLGRASHSYEWQEFYWGATTNSACTKTAAFDIPQFSYRNMSLMYELQTPNPLDMSLGVYTGQIHYTMGPGQDFDFGDVAIPTDNILTFNFNLEVIHLFELVFPANASHLSLIPQGGWQQWLQRGRRPEKLFANLNFKVRTTTSFNVQLQCQHSIGNQCGIENDAGHLVLLETRLTLPIGLMTNTRLPVNRFLLSNSAPSKFQSIQFVDSGAATLHFDVSRDSVAEMTEHPGSRYSGNVTVIWDSEL